MRVLFNEIICYGCKAFIVSGFCVDVQYSLFETKSVKYTYCDVTFMLQNSPLASSLKAGAVIFYNTQCRIITAALIEYQTAIYIVMLNIGFR